MKILITGASGFIGRHLIHALRHRHTLKACVRNPDHWRRLGFDLDYVQTDFAAMTDETAWLPLLESIDAVINCVGIIAENPAQRFSELHSLAPQALFRAAQGSGVRKIIQISALGADSEAQSAYHLSKRAADEALARLPVDWFILRPSIVYGPGAQSMALFHALAALPVHIVLDDGQQLIQPVHIDDLVATVNLCLDGRCPAGSIIDVVGPQTIAYADLLALLRKRLGQATAPVVSVASRLAMKFSGAGKLLGIPALSADGIRMLLRGNNADAEPLSRLLERPPASVQEKLGDVPATQAERWHAGLLLLKPLLRFSLAVLWIASGLVSAFFFPPEQSYAWLAALGITGMPAPLFLYGLAALDILLGTALLIGYRLRATIALQIIATLAYSVVIAVGLPEFWLHPFAPLVKNIPLLIASLILAVLEGERA